MSERPPFFRRVFTPPGGLLAILLLLSCVLLPIVLTDGREQSVIAYIVYPLSAYTLIAAVLSAPRLCRIIKVRLHFHPIAQRIRSHPIGSRYLEDHLFRGHLSLLRGSFISLLFALFKGVTAILYRSVWFGAVGVYYLLLGGIRLFLLRAMQKEKAFTEDARKTAYRWSVYRHCGALLFVLQIGMTGMVLQMVRDNRHTQYPGTVIYGTALYTFCITITAIVNLIKYRKRNHPILSASKAITFLSSLMSVLALQVSMIMQFGAQDDAFRIIANAITGGVVSAAALLIAIYMTVHGYRNERKI